MNKKSIVYASLAYGMLCLVGCGKSIPPPVEGSSSQFAVGQIWTYKTRPGEEASRVVIGKIDRIGQKNVIHIQVIHASIRNPLVKNQIQDRLPHTPIEEKSLADSVIAQEGQTNDFPEFENGYRKWLSAYQNGRGGFFTINVADIIRYVEEAISKGNQ